VSCGLYGADGECWCQHVLELLPFTLLKAARANPRPYHELPMHTLPFLLQEAVQEGPALFGKTAAAAALPIPLNTQALALLLLLLVPSPSRPTHRRLRMA
jgi:hypothetical protein